MPSNLKRQSYPACGRLIILQSIGSRPLADVNQSELDRLAAINFPAMPDTIELARTADYTVSTNWAYPDGIHQYKATQPLKIPVSFKLHTQDRVYCPQGALSLLQVAAELHALTLPIGPRNVKVSAGEAVDGTARAVVNGAAEPASLAGQLEDPQQQIYPPATCFLELIVTDRDLPGIACVGYVAEVRTALMGPWLRGSGSAYNLPSAGEFSFTFIHHPGHGNGFSQTRNYPGQAESQAYARNVRDRFYNTRDLFTHDNFKSLDD